MTAPVSKKELKRMGVVFVGVVPLAVVFAALAKVLPEAIWWPLTIIVVGVLFVRAMFWIEEP